MRYLRLTSDSEEKVDRQRHNESRRYHETQSNLHEHEAKMKDKDNKKYKIICYNIKCFNIYLYQKKKKKS
jgi:hypothetical protein